MIKWLVNLIQKEARRFHPDDNVRYFTHPRKGTGQGIVMTPSFRPGRVVDYDNVLRRYKIRDNQNEDEVLVHPRNLVPNSVSSPKPMQSPQTPATNEVSESPEVPVETPVQTMVAQTQ